MRRTEFGTCYRALSIHSARPLQRYIVAPKRILRPENYCEDTYFDCRRHYSRIGHRPGLFANNISCFHNCDNRTMLHSSAHLRPQRPNLRPNGCREASSRQAFPLVSLEGHP